MIYNTFLVLRGKGSIYYKYVSVNQKKTYSCPTGVMSVALCTTSFLFTSENKNRFSGISKNIFIT